jgi:hypothetical protein
MTESSQADEIQPDPSELPRLLVFSRLDQLALAVRDHLIPNDAATTRVWSVFMTATNGGRRCVRFLTIIAGRYEARAPLNRTTPWEVSTEEVQLDIMSFYLFAKILLDQAGEWIGSVSTTNGRNGAARPIRSLPSNSTTSSRRSSSA